MNEGKMDAPQKATTYETQEQRAEKQWNDYLQDLEKTAKSMGGELRVYDVMGENGKVRPDARRVKVFPMDRTDTVNLSPAFDSPYVLRTMTTTQSGNMKEGKLINEGQEPRPDKADVLRLENDGETLRSRDLLSCSYNPERNRWELFPD
ncbi:MAG: hypothetical protein AAB480_03885 [Patescibacteria group bacterium]